VKTEIPGHGPLVPIKHVNRLLHLGLSTSYAMLREGRYPLPTVRVGRRHHVRREALEAFLAGGLSAEPRRADQERAAVEGRPPNLRALFPNLDEDAHRVAQELVDRAPALSREQLDSIRAVIVGGGDRG